MIFTYGLIIYHGNLYLIQSKCKSKPQASFTKFKKFRLLMPFQSPCKLPILSNNNYRITEIFKKNTIAHVYPILLNRYAILAQILTLYFLYSSRSKVSIFGYFK
jgi:hypothetical protein